MIMTWNARDVLGALREWGGMDDTPEASVWLASVVEQMNRWLARGDGIAVYENQDLRHPEIGDKRFVSYGSSAAQLETDTPPAQLPDGIGGTVNWRYVLTATCRGELLEITPAPEPTMDEHGTVYLKDTAER